jgi:uncharacterized protein YcaQ
LSRAEARRLALAAQGFARSRPSRVGRARLIATIDRLGLLQIDSVNVLVRSHYLPLFSRLGAYPRDALDRLAWGPRRGRALFEYWGHEASLIPLATQPLYRWRMARALESRGRHLFDRFGRERRAYVDQVLAEVAEHGPLTVSDLREPGRSTGPWWGWSDGKTALEWLFYAGLVTTAARRGFERVYDVPARVLPAAVLNQTTPDEADAQRTLVRHAIGALGVATEAEIRDYYRLPPADNRTRLHELIDAGTVREVRVKGWSPRAYMAADASPPRRIRATALLSPFDPVVWMRARAERLFDFHYRIALYTPKHKRSHGYYVLPFLVGDRLVARVDLKADRAAHTLRALSVHGEADVDASAVAAALAPELRLMATWLGLDRVSVGGGDLGPAVRAEVRALPAS